MSASGDLIFWTDALIAMGSALSLIGRAKFCSQGQYRKPFPGYRKPFAVWMTCRGAAPDGRGRGAESEVFSERAWRRNRHVLLILGRPLGGDGGDKQYGRQAPLWRSFGCSAPLAGNIANTLALKYSSLRPRDRRWHSGCRGGLYHSKKSFALWCPGYLSPC